MQRSQCRNEVILKSCVWVIVVVRIEHENKVVHDRTEIFPCYIQKCRHRDVVSCALEEADDLLPHLTLVGPVAKRTWILDGLAARSGGSGEGGACPPRTARERGEQVD